MGVSYRMALKCLDCGVNTSAIKEYYMVRDDVWAEAIGSQDACDAGMLCIGCLENRLCRRLTSSDFAPVPINSGSNHSHRLMSRLVGL